MATTTTPPTTKLAPTVPRLSADTAESLIIRLQERLGSLTDLALTLKHVHWNVVGPGFIAVHQMLDPQYQAVSDMVDQVAERIATLGGSPNGLPGHLVANRTWDDYDIQRAPVMEHLAALDLVYQGVIGGHRDAMDESQDTDPVTQDMYIGQISQLEQFLWFVRAHLEAGDGTTVSAGARTERQAARKAGRRSANGTG